MLTISRQRTRPAARYLAVYLACSVISMIGGTPPAKADYLATKINRLFLDPDSISVVSDGYQNGDIVKFIVETTPDIASGSLEGHAAWMTVYVPAGVQVLCAPRKPE